MTEDNSIEEHLKELEQRLLRPEVRNSAGEVGALLADDFKEFVSTGQIYNKAQIIEMLQKAPTADSALTDFKVLILAPDVALATFFTPEEQLKIDQRQNRFAALFGSG